GTRGPGGDRRAARALRGRHGLRRARGRRRGAGGGRPLGEPVSRPQPLLRRGAGGRARRRRPVLGRRRSEARRQRDRRGGRLMRRALAAAAPVMAVAVVLAVGLAGCFDVQSADLFLLTRTGQGGKLTLLVNDGGTVRCDGAKAKPISNTSLIAARDLADN